MPNKTVKIILIILVILTCINTFAIIGVSAILNSPRASSQIEVLGAAFKDEEMKNVVDIDLIRPPRTMASPGDSVEQNLTITNTANFQTFLRMSYVVYVNNGEGEEVEEFEKNVDVCVNDDWIYKDGYWYYKETVEPGEMIVGPIDSIEYSEAFSKHRDYKVYVPMIIESVEVKNNEIESVDYWPNDDIDDVEYKRLNKSVKWTTNTQLIIG